MSSETAIVEGIAQILADQEETSTGPAKLRDYRLMSLELSQLVAGTKYRGEFEERLQAILQELTDPKAPPTILFIDEVSICRWHSNGGARTCTQCRLNSGLIHH